MDDVTWLESGTLYGKPVNWLSCEVTCGTKQKWKVGVSPAIAQGEDIDAYNHNIVIMLDPYDSSGGACSGGFHPTDNPMSHRVIATVQRYHENRLQSEDQVVVVGGLMSGIALNGAGTYHIGISTSEWGEDCTKPDNKGKVTIKVVDAPNSPSITSSNISTNVDGQATPVFLIPILLLAGGGTFLLISNL